FVLSIGTDMVLEKAGYMQIEPFSFNSNGIIALVLICRTVYFILGGYLTAGLAPTRPMLHVMIIGIVGLLMNIAGAISLWNNVPHWFPVSIILLSYAGVWLGGKLKTSIV